MIRTETEYADAQMRLQNDRRAMDEQRSRLAEMGLSSSEVEHAMEPFLSFHDQLREEVDMYERMRRGDPAVVNNLRDIGRVLIGLRISRGITQRELAMHLGVSESQVSRDERNDYHGLTVDRAQRIIDALKGQVRLEAEAQGEDKLLVP